ncbi:MAG: rRNA maturation RNase YbeY [Bacteroidales bacterium]|nr:rRNA maturation RNase YbeY [Bacteroidales bacterium]
MAITFSNNDIKFSLKEKTRLKKWITQVVEKQKKRVGDIGYLFCDDEYILQVNREYLDHDTYTDIITFDYVEGDVISGDILISIDRVGENAKTFGCTFEHELHRVIIHGVLHLLGNKDKTDAEATAMRKKENQALKNLENFQ